MHCCTTSTFGSCFSGIFSYPCPFSYFLLDQISADKALHLFYSDHLSGVSVSLGHDCGPICAHPESVYFSECDGMWSPGVHAIAERIPGIVGELPFVLFFNGLAQTTGAKAGFIHKTLFIYVSLMALYFLKEREKMSILTRVQANPEISTNDSAYVTELVTRAKNIIKQYCNLPLFPVLSQGYLKSKLNPSHKAM